MNVLVASRHAAGCSERVDGSVCGLDNRGEQEPGHAAQRVALMANISAQMVKELRERTGAGMMDCKGALSDTAGDMEQAVDLLRKKGLAKAARKAGRIAAEGLIGVAVDGLKGVVVEVNSETDFVARNELFQGLVKMIANVGLTVGADVEKIKRAKVGSLSVEDAIADTISKVGENMSLRRASFLIFKNIVANAAKSAFPEEYIDRWGRLKGNMIGLLHVAKGKLDPMYALKL